MSKVALILGVALVSLAPASAFASERLVEVGLPDGRLASTALSAGEYDRAAVRLNVVRPDAANDPARLINLGNAYVGLGRMADARAAYQSARYAPDMMLVTADGGEASSRDIARRALSRLETRYAAR